MGVFNKVILLAGNCHVLSVGISIRMKYLNLINVDIYCSFNGTYNVTYVNNKSIFMSEIRKKCLKYSMTTCSSTEPRLNTLLLAQYNKVKSSINLIWIKQNITRRATDAAMEPATTATILGTKEDAESQNISTAVTAMIKKPVEGHQHHLYSTTTTLLLSSPHHHQHHPVFTTTSLEILGYCCFLHINKMFIKYCFEAMHENEKWDGRY